MCADIDAQCGNYDVLIDTLNRFRAGESICLQGNAGTGKSYAMSILAQQADLMFDRREIAFVAPNGIACHNLDFRAVTIHTLLGYNTIHIDASAELAIRHIVEVEGKHEELKAIRVIFFDEVGAISSAVGFIIDKVFRFVNGNDKYMGGVQVIAAGQLLQLSGIIDSQHKELTKELGVDAMGMLPEFIDNTTAVYLNRIFRTVDIEFQQ
jgi:hypothetical protein